MAKDKFYFDAKTLSYKKIEKTLWGKLKNTFYFLFAASVFGFISVLVIGEFVDSPKEKELKREVNNLRLNYDLLNRKMSQAEVVLQGIQERDNKLYRVYFEAEPISDEVRKSGFGGINRYSDLEGFENSELVISNTKKLDVILKQLYTQSKSLDQIVELAKNKEELFSHIPAIQPVANKDLKRMASGYGYRMDPIYKVRRFHAGMDFSAEVGTPIYSTGDGVVTKVLHSGSYGKHLRIDHGFGYQTLYAHMNEFTVKVGQKIKRGEIIGYVGNTGKSTGPHLHYEVHKNGKVMNPVNFYHNDLTPEEYDRLLKMSLEENQSMD